MGKGPGFFAKIPLRKSARLGRDGKEDFGTFSELFLIAL